MTEELQAFESVKLKTSLTAHQTSLSKEETALFTKAVLELALAKNVKLQDGTIRVWSDCLKQDIEFGLFTLQQFISATKKAIRRSVFNRLDYADLYREAINISYRETEAICPRCKTTLTPDNYSLPCWNDDSPYSKEHSKVSGVMQKIAHEFRELSEFHE